MTEVRRATLADKQAIFNFLAKAYGDKARYKFPERWEWQFENNPFRNSDELPVWVAVDEEGSVVGQICAMIEPLLLGDEIHRLSWAVDLVVLPEHRRRGIGFELCDALHRDNDFVMALPMSQAFRRFTTKRGSEAVDPVVALRRVARLNAPYVLAALRSRLEYRRSGKTLLWVLRHLRLHLLVAVMVNAGVRMRDRRLTSQGETDVVIRQVARFDHAVDELWSALSSRFRAAVQRTSDYLNWKYVLQPYMDYELFTAARAGRVCGYVILRRARPPESDSGVIADLLAPPEDTVVIRSLLAFAVEHFKQLNATFVVAATSVREYEDVMSALGFRPTGILTPLLFGGGDTSVGTTGRVSGGWLLGRGDHDWDQYPYA